jgi:intracellular sulfur oxidation DsrE/DsrF family protein
MANVALALALALAGNALAADTSAEKRRVIMQVNEEDEDVWEQALRLAENMQQNGGGKDKIDIEIAAFGPGVLMLLKDSSVASRVTKAAENGVQLRACAYTLSARKLNPDRLAPGVKTVPFAALEVVDKQKEGWSYIKP